MSHWFEKARACVVAPDPEGPGVKQAAAEALSRMMRHEGPLRPRGLRYVETLDLQEVMYSTTEELPSTPVVCFEARAYPSLLVLWQGSSLRRWNHSHVLRHNCSRFTDIQGISVTRCECGARWPVR